MLTKFDFTTFPVLETARLILDQSTQADAAALFASASDPEVQKFDSTPPMKDISEAIHLIEQGRIWFEEKKAICWNLRLKESGQSIGGIGFYFWEKEYYKTDLGYTVNRTHWQQGYATEALLAILAFGFEEMGLHRVNVDTRMDNLASLGLMRRLGFVYEGARRECVLSADGTYQTWGLFGMLEDEYRHMCPA